MSITYNGKLNFSDIVPGLNSAATALQEKNQEVSDFLAARSKNVSSLQSRVTSIQDEMTRAQTVADDAQAVLTSAQDLLTQAQSLTTSLTDSLTASGIYSYNFVGQVGNFGTEFSSQLSGGLPGGTGATENIAAVVLIIGAGSDPATAVTNINAVMGQIGNNASAIVADFQAL